MAPASAVSAAFAGSLVDATDAMTIGLAVATARRWPPAAVHSPDSAFW
jgi:uncharacterized membrane protein